MISARRAILVSARTLQRTKPLRFADPKKIRLREPIVPTHKNFDVSPDHPLWAFFRDGNKTETVLRSKDDLSTDSRPWDMPELRLKSFDDLHRLWYLNALERNRISTEAEVAKEIYNGDVSLFTKLDDNHLMTQKRIKQTLLERQVAYERAQLSSPEEYLQLFEEKYINADESAIAEYNEKLVRLQYAIFGIEPDLSEYNLEEDINVKFVEGLSYVAKLKLGRYLASNPAALELPLNGVMEELPFLVRDPEVAVEEVRAMREEGVSRKLDNIEVFAFLRNAIEAVRSEPEELAEEEN